MPFLHKKTTWVVFPFFLQRFQSKPPSFWHKGRHLNALGIHPDLYRSRFIRVQRLSADRLVGGIDFRKVPATIIAKHHPSRRAPLR
jgi:hypothetical protein